MSLVDLTIFDGHTAIVGRVGSGKSFAARGLVEAWLAAGLRVCVVDPTAVWYGLRSNFAGDGPGFPVVIFGGEHADVPIGERSGERIAEIVASRNLPAVIATADMTVGERHRFMSDFLGTLYRRNKLPLHLVLDEADDVAPQNPLPENRRMLGDVDRIVRRGRVKGFRVTLITQRPAVLHKNVLSQASTLIAMRLPAPQDRKAIEEWIKGQADIEQAREVLGSLSGLGRGEGWVWAPERDVLMRTKFPMITTFDSMRTPEHGEEITAPTTLAAVELGDLRALMVAEDDQNDNGRVRPGHEDIAAAEKRGYERGDRDGYLRGMAELTAAVSRIIGAGEALNDAIAAFRRLPLQNAAAAPAREAPVAESAPAAISAPPAKDRAPAPPQRPVDGLPVSAGKMLAVLARGMRLTWAQTATLAGLKARGGSFNTARKALRDGGYLVEDESGITASAQGFEVAGGRKPAPNTPDELITWWRSVLPQTSARVLDQLYRQDGKWIKKDRLAGFLAVAPRGGSWNTALSILRQNALIEVKGDQVRLGRLM